MADANQSTALNINEESVSTPVDGTLTTHNMSPHDDFADALIEFEHSGDQPGEGLPEAIQSEPGAGTPSLPLEAIYNVPVTVTAVLGKRRIDVATLMTLGSGAIVDLDRKVGDPVDLYINDQLIARGELVIADGGLGISMTEIVQPQSALITSPDEGI